MCKSFRLHKAHHNQPSHKMTLALHLAGEAATTAFGQALARVLRPGLKIYLSGELGAGKTTLVRALLRGLGWADKVKSPSYALVELYEVSSLYLHHFDFYRLNKPEEWMEAGLHEYFDGSGVCLVEWPEKAGELLPRPDIVIRMRVADGAREVTIAAETEAGSECLAQLKT